MKNFIILLGSYLLANIDNYSSPVKSVKKRMNVEKRMNDGDYLMLAKAADKRARKI